VGETCHGLKSRYLSIVVGGSTVAGVTQTIQVEIVALKQCSGGTNNGRGCEVDVQCPGGTCANSPTIGDIWWAGAEESIPNSPHPALTGAGLECTGTPNAQVWTAGNLYMYGAPVAPAASYNVRICDSAGANCSAPTPFETGEWGDAVAPYGGISQPNFADINEVVFKFRNLASSLDVPRVDLVGVGNPGTPNTPNQNANFADISAAVEGFRGIGYAYSIPACP
jgi:hypothetical protein